MMNFKDWILQEQPHLYAKQPISFTLNGDLYQDIISIDPRIERWPNQDIKLRFFRYAIGSVGERNERIPPQTFYFIDDNNKIFEVLTGKNQSIVQQTNQKPQPHFIMPEYWHNYAQFRTSNDEYIDNTDPTMSIRNLSIV
jgi:hypothetical protein